MSYNIDSIKTVANENFRINGEMLQKALDELDGMIPEDNFLDDLPDPRDRRSEWKSDAWYDIGKMSWCGEGSGHTYDQLIKVVLPKTMGKCEFILAWEGGDSINGIRVEEGIVYECDVALKLGKGKRVK
jgi:hypothetical protein